MFVKHVVSFLLFNFMNCIAIDMTCFEKELKLLDYHVLVFLSCVILSFWTCVTVSLLTFEYLTMNFGETSSIILNRVNA